MTTKLHVPQQRPDAVFRTRLAAQLEVGIGSRLTLIAAPAGFGKTSVLAGWIASSNDSRKVAWLSLDEGDNAPEIFWRYFLASMNEAVLGIANAALSILDEPAAVIESVLTTLINDCHEHGADIVVVLDDLHVINRPEIHSGIAFLMDNLPSHVHLVIASRTDPPLPLARLRARRELVELRVADLRFTIDEAASYLRGSMSLSLTDEEIAALEGRTEGWIAALQLAALSLEERSDSAEFIAGFAGDNRYIVDYLLEEVLHRQAPQVVTFLMQTSILSRLSGDLVDAVTRGADGAATLEALYRSNVLIDALDDKRHWYRYHHLFAQMLRARLVDKAPGTLDELNLRASAWYAEHHQFSDAIAHAIDAHAYDRAADLIEMATPSMRKSRQESTLVRWLNMLPPELIRSRPSLSVQFAGTLLAAGQLDGVEDFLRDADDGTVGGGDEIQAVRRGIAVYRAAHSIALGDMDGAAFEATRALDLTVDGDAITQGSATGLLGLVSWSRGELAVAESYWLAALSYLERAGHISDAIGASIAISDLQVAQGRLSAALHTCSQALEMANRQEPLLRGAADMQVSISEILRQRGDLVGARVQLAAATALGEYAGLPQNRHRRRIASARLLVTEGDAAGAVALLEEAEQVFTPDFFPNTQPIAAQRARALIVGGRIDQATDWAARSGFQTDDELSFMHEYEHITLVRLMLADKTNPAAIAAAIEFLQRLLIDAEAGGRLGSVIEIRVLLAQALHAAGRAPESLEVLRHAVATAEPERYVRVFADEGPSMSRLLSSLSKREPGSSYVRQLVNSTVASARSTSSSTSELVTPLSDREIDVLRLLRTEFGGADIARQLSISLNTMRTHTKSIYMKLGVTSRRAAVNSATELGLFR